MGPRGVTGSLLLCLSLVASGCASIESQPGFTEVASAVEQRIRKEAVWERNPGGHQSITAAINSLLEEELDAEMAVQVALLNNRDLQATYESLSIAQAELVAAGALQNPVFDSELRFPTSGGRVGLEFGVAQNFLSILFIPLKKAVAETAFESAKLRVTKEVLTLAAEVKVAFYSAQASLQLLEVKKSVVAATEASFLVAQALRDAGNITAVDYLHERASYEMSKIELHRAESELLRNRERVTTLLGLWGVQTNWQMRSQLPQPVLRDENDDELERRAILNSLELQIAKNDITESAQLLGITQPFRGITEGELGVFTEREGDGSWKLGPKFSFPLPIFTQGQPAIAASEARLFAARQRYYATAVKIRSQIRVAQAILLAAEERVEYYSDVLLPLRQEILAQTQLQYNAMQVGAFQLLQAKRDQIQTASDYIAALHDYWLAHTEREQLLNGTMVSFSRASPSPVVTELGVSQSFQNGGH